METSKVCIPVEIIRNSKLSPRARLIWAELSLLPKGAVGEFVVNQKELSQQLGICVSTLRRAIQSLEENKLIQYVGLFNKRYKKYVFKGCHSKLDLESSPNVDSLDVSLHQHDKTVEVPPANNRADPDHLISCFMKEYGGYFIKQFKYFDGKEDRPELVQLILDIFNKKRDLIYAKNVRQELQEKLVELQFVLFGTRTLVYGHADFAVSVCKKRQELIQNNGFNRAAEVVKAAFARDGLQNIDIKNCEQYYDLESVALSLRGL